MWLEVACVGTRTPLSLAGERKAPARAESWMISSRLRSRSGEDGRGVLTGILSAPSLPLEALFALFLGCVLESFCRAVARVSRMYIIPSTRAEGAGAKTAQEKSMINGTYVLYCALARRTRCRPTIAHLRFIIFAPPPVPASPGEFLASPFRSLLLRARKCLHTLRCRTSQRS